MANDKFLKLVRSLGQEKVKLGEPMAKHTTFKIGGPADLFYEAKSEEELIGAIKVIREIGVPYFLLGGGSNILVSDRGFRGMVVKIRNTQYAIRNTRIIAEAGAPTPLVLQTALRNNLAGLEFLRGVPGTIGGAVVTNAKALFLGNFLKEPISIGDVFEKVKVLTRDRKIKEYRRSHYKHTLSYSSIKNSRDIVLSVEFRLRRGVSPKALQYMKDYDRFRQDKPYRDYPTPGSIFQNPPAKSAGWLVDQCGLKGKRIGQAQISPLHANFIVNLGGATCQDVLKLIALAKKKVKEKFGVELKEEIEIVEEF